MNNLLVRTHFIIVMIRWTGLAPVHQQREFFIDNLLVRTHFIVVMIRWTGLALVHRTCHTPFLTKS